MSQWAAIGANGKVLSWIQHGVAISWKRAPPPPFNQGVSLLDASPAQLSFLNTELSRLESEGAWEKSTNPRWVSRMFLVPKPGTNKWRLIVDLRHLNLFCRDFPMKYETLKRMRNISKQGN